MRFAHGRLTGIALVFAVGAATGRADDWKATTDDKLGLSFEVPGKVESKDINSADGRLFQRVCFANSGNEYITYAVNVYAGNRPSPPLRLDERDAREFFGLGERNYKITAIRLEKIDGRDVLEVEGTFTLNGGTTPYEYIAYRGWIADGKDVYACVRCSTADKLKGKDVKRFLESVKPVAKKGR